MSGDKSRSVFIGNIPYGLSEEQIISTLSSVGQVLHFRLVYDQETGKPKGFGFAEFADADAAASAVRNLNNYEIMGRNLRVDFSHVGNKDDASGQNQQQQQPLNQQMPLPNGYPQPPLPANGVPILPPLPPGTDVPQGLTAPDVISKTLTTLPPEQLLGILSEMKGLATSEPAKAAELLNRSPQLSYALFQALLLLNLVDSKVLGQVVEQATAQPAVPQPIPQQQPQAQPPPQQQAPYAQQPPQQFAPPPPHALPPHLQPQAQQQLPHLPTPPVQAQAYQQPPLPQQARPPMPPQQQQPVVGGQSQEELIKMVMAMTQQQVDALQPGEREQVMALRQALMGRY